MLCGAVKEKSLCLTSGFINALRALENKCLFEKNLWH